VRQEKKRKFEKREKGTAERGGRMERDDAETDRKRECK
jgi:hypothetical protein